MRSPSDEHPMRKGPAALSARQREEFVMKIVVLVKEVPDTYGDRRLSLETGLADRAVGETVLDESGERALEVALSYADTTPGTEVVVLSMAPESASTTVRKGLAMGAASAVQVVDEGLLGADLGLTAEVLAAALQRTGFDLVIGGNISTDGAGGVVPVMVAEILDVPSATYLSAVEIGDGEVSGTRASDGASMRVTAPLPAVISITEALPDARFPNFKGIMAAKKKPFETLSLAELDIEPHDPDASRSIVISLSEKPPRGAGVKIVDEGDAGQKLADFLIQNRLV
jgi:electron transfer flavoprotein beta subunit